MRLKYEPASEPWIRTVSDEGAARLRTRQGAGALEKVTPVILHGVTGVTLHGVIDSGLVGSTDFSFITSQGHEPEHHNIN